MSGVRGAAATTPARGPAVGSWSHRLARRTNGQDGALTGILALANATGVINFSGGFPDPSFFPTELLAPIAGDLLSADAAIALQYAPSEGIASTREAIADRLLRTDGRRPAAGELMITSGGIDAVTLIAKSMLDPGDVVVVEEPTYLGAVAGFAGLDATMRAVPVDEDGLDGDALGALLGRSGAAPVKVLYTIPEYQNPSGRTLSLPRRLALVELARRHSLLIAEDVAYRELGFAGPPLPSLWSIAPDVVVQMGTYSKTFFPGVRLGWAAGPADVVAQLSVAKQNSDQCAGALGQRMLEAFLRGGHFDAQLDRARALYRRRGAAMHDALRQHLTELGDWTTPTGGFFAWLRLPGIDTTALASAARAVDVAYVPGAGFFCEHPDTEHLRLSFSRVTEPDIAEGVARLTRVAAYARLTDNPARRRASR
ncbi:MAG: PLP-dependent aminotransferase family protein [Mycobacteriales bacterium]